MMRKVISVAVLLAAVFSVGEVFADEHTDLIRIVPKDVAPEDGSWTGVDMIIALHPTGETLTMPENCGAVSGVTGPVWRVAVLNGRNTYLVDVIPDAGSTIDAHGQRWDIIDSDTRECCLDENMNVISCLNDGAMWSVRQASIRSSQSTTSDLLLFESTEPITADHVGVVTGPQDENGFADAVFSKKGEKPVSTVLLTPDLVEQGDKISDVILLDYDEETGIALYGATVEY